MEVFEPSDSVCWNADKPISLLYDGVVPFKPQMAVCLRYADEDKSHKWVAGESYSSRGLFFPPLALAWDLGAIIFLDREWWTKTAEAYLF